MRFVPKLAALFLFAFSVAGCVSAVPAWTGGSTTPKRRADVAAGGAVRVTLGEGAPSESRFHDAANAAGVTPVAMIRYGVARHLDLGVMVAGTNVRAELRREFVLEEDTTRPTIVIGGSVSYGYIPNVADMGSGSRFTAEIPVAYAVDFGGIYDAWIGARVAAELVTGSFMNNSEAPRDASAFAVRAGPMIGLAAGLRRVHAFMELTVAYEHWFGSHEASGGDVSLRRGGWVLLPSFGFRLRI